MVAQLMAVSPAQSQFYLMALIAETAPGKAARAGGDGKKVADILMDF